MTITPINLHCCGKVVRWIEDKLPRYCPHCGAAISTDKERNAKVA